MSINIEVKEKIDEMFVNDQRMRMAYQKGQPWDSSVDINNTKYAKEVIKEIGYPTKSKVGEDSSHHFWFFIQHADHDLDFQKECLELMKLLSKPEVNQKDVAYLEDRIRSAEGKPLLYGTQFWTNPETKEYEPKPIEDFENLDVRREAVGMEPFAEYKEMMLEIFKNRSKE